METIFRVLYPATYKNLPPQVLAEEPGTWGAGALVDHCHNKKLINFSRIIATNKLRAELNRRLTVNLTAEERWTSIESAS